MPASPTTRNRFKKPEVGAELNTWGEALNTSVIDLVDAAIDGWVTISTGGATTLTSNNYLADQSRMRLINYTAATAGVVTIPSVQKWYLVRSVSANVQITNGGTSVTVLAGDTSIVATDGSTVYKVQSNDFNNRNIVNLLDPTSDQHAATKLYVDSVAFAASSGSFPGQTGNAGRVLGTNATNPLWVNRLPDQASKSGRFLKSTGTDQAEAWDWPIPPLIRKTGAYTAVARERIEANTTGGAFTITLPATPTEGDWVYICDAGASPSANGFGANALTVARNGSTIGGLSEDLTVTAKGAAFTLEYSNATWRPQLG